MGWVLVLGAVGWILFLMTLVLTWEERHSQWTGEVQVMLDSMKQHRCYDGRPLLLNAYDQVRAFYLIGVEPGRCPGIRVEESFAGGSRSRWLLFEMQWRYGCYASDGQSSLVVMLPESVGQTAHSPLHELTLWVKAHAGAEEVAFMVEWLPLEVIAA